MMEKFVRDEIIFADELENEISAIEGRWKLLVVDDEEEVHKVTRLALKGLKLDNKTLEIISAYSGTEAIEILKKDSDIAIAMIDVVMENDHAGLDMVKVIRETLSNDLIRIIIRTGQAGVAPEKKVIEEYDISDYKEKSDLSFEKLYTSIYTGLKGYRNMLELVKLTNELKKKNQHLSRENSFLKKEVYKLLRPVSLIGNSKAWIKTLEMVEHIAQAGSNVLIYGETGTGKEMIARFIHFNNEEIEKPFITVNCASLSKDLLESELFGHKRGSFTGAESDRKGLFEEAHGGTLFLDEIGDMVLEMQAKVLRAIQFGEIKRVGENKHRNVKVRVISATNKDLRRLVAQGRFREDLYYRLAIFHLTVPPLRERIEDLPLLVNHFLKENSGDEKTFTTEVLEMMSLEDYPGNIRELENKVERMVNIAGNKAVIDMDIYRISKKLEGKSPDLMMPSVPTPNIDFTDSFNLKNTVQEFELNIVLRAIELCGGKKTDAARILGIPERTLFNKLSQ